MYLFFLSFLFFRYIDKYHFYVNNNSNDITGYNFIKIFQEIKFSLIHAINLLKNFIRMKKFRFFSNQTKHESKYFLEKVWHTNKDIYLISLFYDRI